ncbi:hypothetical protein ACOCJ5_14180 [Knoellia sp. CPCC 206450]|uniref:hypothetical protein n=1 Tax=Knoellia tibetensis TaxID=3404798 RepID=UPI003B43C414
MGQQSGLHRTAEPSAVREEDRRARAERVQPPYPGRPGVPSIMGLAARVLPWVLGLALPVSYLLIHETPAEDVLRYAVYLALGVVLPGTLIVRALRPPVDRPAVEDLALGAATGMVGQLVALVLAVLAGHASWARWWPVPVVVASLLVPVLRRRCWTRDGSGGRVDAAPLWWHWGVAGAVAVVGVLAARPFVDFPLPPAQGVYYVDLPWHLALVHAILRSVPPEVPQVAGLTAEYHWFSDADMAAASVVSGVPEAVVLLRLWPVAVLAAGGVLVSVLARRLSGSWAAGVLAAWIFSALRGVQVLPVHVAESPLVPFSPSHGYVVVLTLAAMTLVVPALRGEPVGRGGWVVLAGLLLAAGGGKPVVLPTVACGALVAAVAGRLVLRDRVRARAALGLFLACAALLPLTATTFSGSDSTSQLRPFGFMSFHPLFRAVTDTAGGAGGTSGDGFAGVSARAAQIVVLMLVALAFSHLGTGLGVFAFLSRSVRRDPAAWFVGGALVASLGGYLLLMHPAYSQVYFVRLALAYGAAVQAWVLVGAVRRLRGRRVGAAVAAAGAVAGAALAWLTARLVPPLTGAEAQSLHAWRWAFAESLLVFVGGLLLIALGVVLLGRRAGRSRGVAATVVVSALVVGAPAHAVRQRTVVPVVDALEGRTRQVVTTPRGPNDIPLPAGGAAAMAWVATHTPPDAVVATNRHCSRGIVERACASNLYWVSGLGGRQTVLESWAYVPVFGGPTRPDPYPARRAENDALFTAPTTEGFAAMKRKLGLSWLVSDSTATPVSPELTRFATPRFSAGTVTVWEVR